jgi:hypothetical protein
MGNYLKENGLLGAYGIAEGQSAQEFGPAYMLYHVKKHPEGTLPVISLSPFLTAAIDSSRKEPLAPLSTIVMASNRRLRPEGRTPL